MLQGTSGTALARTCVTKLANFLQDDDQNCETLFLSPPEQLTLLRQPSKVYCAHGHGEDRADTSLPRRRISRDDNF